MKRKPNWIPRKRGAVYCSSACGSGCTMADHMNAKRDADRLAKRLAKLTGGVWDTVVHENMGWHFYVTRRQLEVHNYGLTSGAWASIILCGKQVHRHAKTPELAVKAVLKELEVIAATFDYYRKEILKGVPR